jgi:hypothetical protein
MASDSRLEAAMPHPPQWPDEHDLALIEDSYYFMLSRVLRGLRHLPPNAAATHASGTTATVETQSAA